jgi:AcrR family transcriptional regulator
MKVKPDVPAGRGLRLDAARNQERILRAAAGAFEQLGPAASLEEVARRAGVGIATVYRRFGSREQLVRAVFAHLFATEIEPATAATSASWVLNGKAVSLQALAERNVAPYIATGRQRHHGQTTATGHSSNDSQAKFGCVVTSDVGAAERPTPAPARYGDRTGRRRPK